MPLQSPATIFALAYPPVHKTLLVTVTETQGGPSRMFCKDLSSKMAGCELLWTPVCFLKFLAAVGP